MSEQPKKHGYYWAKGEWVWEIVQIDSGEHVWAIGLDVELDANDFTFGPEVTKPEGLE